VCLASRQQARVVLPFGGLPPEPGWREGIGVGTRRGRWTLVAH
jgi:hypothetical protein